MLSRLSCGSLPAAASVLRRGGALIFPTETFYGLGSLAADAVAVARVYQLKRRPVHKPLPLLAATVSQAAAVARLDAMPPELLAFWPGPLTALLPARPGLPAPLVNADGKVAVRVTPHPTAAALALAAGGALTASSANASGGRPVCRPEDLDAALLLDIEAMLASLAGTAAACGLLLDGPLPVGGAPSTMVEPLLSGPEGARLRLVRPGAVSVAALAAAGCIVE